MLGYTSDDSMHGNTHLSNIHDYTSAENILDYICVVNMSCYKSLGNIDDYMNLGRCKLLLLHTICTVIQTLVTFTAKHLCTAICSVIHVSTR